MDLPGAGLEILDHGLRRRVPLGDLEGAEVLLACIALVDCAENVDELVLRIGYSLPAQLHRGRLDVVDVQGELKLVGICVAMNKNLAVTMYLVVLEGRERGWGWFPSQNPTEEGSD